MTKRLLLLLASSSSTLAVTAQLGCSADDDPGTPGADAAPQADADVDDPAADAGDPSAMPPGGRMSFVIVHPGRRYGLAEFWSDVTLVEGADDPLYPMEVASEDELTIVADEPVEPSNEYTYLDAWPNVFGFAGEEMFTFALDPESLVYAMEFVDDAPVVEAPLDGSFLIPAAGDLPEARYDDVVTITPVTFEAPGVTAIPDGPVTVTWSGVPEGVPVSVDTFALTSDMAPHRLCFSNVVNDGEFALPAECVVLRDAIFLALGLTAWNQTVVDYNGRAVMLEARYQVQISLAPAEPEEPNRPKPTPALLPTLRERAAGCLTDARASEAHRGSRALEVAVARCLRPSLVP